MTVRLLPFETWPGPINMAADDVLLEAGTPALRFYGWAEPTLSLGYFQPAADRLTDPRLAALPWVRRASGGAAIVHDADLTYALALPPGREFHAGGPWVCRFHHIVQDVLTDLGIPSHGVVCGEEKKLGPVLCFLHQTPGDVLVDGSKVVGSAQRRWKGAVLQHGSILLRRSDAAPALPGLRELTGKGITGAGLRAAITTRFAAATGWEFVAGDWTADERRRTDMLAVEKYASREWNEKR